MRGVLILLGVFTLDERESDIAFKWLVGKFHVLFTPSDDKDQKKFSSSLSLSVNGPLYLCCPLNKHLFKLSVRVVFTIVM